MPLGPAFLTVAGTGPYNLSASLNTYSTCNHGKHIQDKKKCSVKLQWSLSTTDTTVGGGGGGGVGEKEVSLQKFFVHFYVAGTTGSVLIRDVPLY